MSARRDPETRFWAKVNRGSDDECWGWTAGKMSKGYGKFWADGKATGAHRISYELLRGPIPDGLQIDHLCRNRACVNPDHLEPVDSRTNTLRGVGFAAKRAAQTHCVRGHPFDEANTYLHPDGRRRCRECKRMQRRKRSQRRAEQAKETQNA